MSQPGNGWDTCDYWGVTSPTLVSPRSGAGARASVAVLAVPRTARGVGTAAVTIVVALALLLPIGAVLQVVTVAQVDDRTRTQSILVMDPGHVWGDPGPVMASRIGHAVDLYRDGVAPVIVLTGPVRSAALARAELISDGVPARDIVSFTTGADTVGSLEVFAGVMRDLGWSATTIVTDPAHAARAQATAAALGIDAHLSPTSEGAGTALTSEYVGRETLALLRFHLVTRWSLPQILR